MVEATAVDALDIIDRGLLRRYVCSTSKRELFLVESRAKTASERRRQADGGPDDSPGGLQHVCLDSFCSCRAFLFQLAGTGQGGAGGARPLHRRICKHLLAVAVAKRAPAFATNVEVSEVDETAFARLACPSLPLVWFDDRADIVDVA